MKKKKNRMLHLISVSTVCKQFSHFSLGTYLELKLDSSNMYIMGEFIQSSNIYVFVRNMKNIRIFRFKKAPYLL